LAKLYIYFHFTIKYTLDLL